jgi:hypothetical protein
MDAWILGMAGEEPAAASRGIRTFAPSAGPHFFGALLWGLAIAYHQAFRFPSLGLLVDTLAATVPYWFAFQWPDVRNSWLEPGGKPPAK